MNFHDMRATVSLNIFDFLGSAFADSEIGRYVNHAMHHIESQIAIVDRNLMLTVFNGTIANQSNEPFIVRVLDPLVNAKARRIVNARRTDAGLDSDDRSLEIIEFQNAEHEATGTAHSKPKIFLFNQDLGFVRPPETEIDVRVYYVQVLPDMFADDDTPGQNSGSPADQENALPGQYHHLITSYATLLALAAENAPIDQWRMLYAEQAAAAGFDIEVRARTQEGKRVNVR